MGFQVEKLHICAELLFHLNTTLFSIDNNEASSFIWAVFKFTRCPLLSNAFNYRILNIMRKIYNYVEETIVSRVRLMSWTVRTYLPFLESF